MLTICARVNSHIMRGVEEKEYRVILTSSDMSLGDGRSAALLR